MAAEAASLAGLRVGAKAAPASNLFPRIDQAQLAGQEAAASPSPKPAQKVQVEDEKKAADAPAGQLPEISFDTFKSLDLRVGTVVEAERHPKADRLLRLLIDFGEAEPRQILSGIAEYYAPEDLVGRQVCAVLNLAPRKIRGLMSCGMVLTAGEGDCCRLLTPDEALPAGSPIS